MDILIVDRDTAAAQTLQNLLEAEGHRVVHETVRKAAQERLAGEDFDVIFVDPAPLPSVREFSMPLRWERRDRYFYLVQTGYDIDEHNITRNGMNSFLRKPFIREDVHHVLEDASRLTGLMEKLRSHDASPTDSHIFGQRGFYQLIVSALDRAYRYHEQAFLLNIRVNNMQALAPQANEVMQALGGFLSGLHRLSDFLGHTDHDEFMLLILRPAVDTEPQDAVERFETALRDFQDQINLRIKPGFDLSLWALPSAGLVLKKELLK